MTAVETVIALYMKDDRSKILESFLEKIQEPRKFLDHFFLSEIIVCIGAITQN